jgi:hypothetical protein
MDSNRLNDRLIGGAVASRRSDISSIYFSLHRRVCVGALSLELRVNLVRHLRYSLRQRCQTRIAALIPRATFVTLPVLVLRRAG